MEKRTSADDKLSQFNALLPDIMSSIKYETLLTDTKHRSPRLRQRIVWSLAFTCATLGGFTYNSSSSLWARDFMTMSNALSMGFTGFGFFIRTCVLGRSPNWVKDTFFLDFTGFSCNRLMEARALDILSARRAHVFRVHRIIDISIILNYLAWMVFPLVPQVYSLMKGSSYDEFSKKFPTSLMVETGWGYRELRYIFELYFTSMIIRLWTASTSMIYAVVNMIDAQYQILAESLILMHRNDVESEKELLLKYLINDQLKLRVSIKLSKFVSPIMVIIVMNVISSLALNVTSLKMQHPGDDNSELIIRYLKCAFYICLSLAELALFCFLSEKLCSANSSFSYAIYSTINWHAAKGALKSLVLFPMVICKREIRLEASKMLVLHLRTVLDILKFTYSYCAVLTKNDA